MEKIVFGELIMEADKEELLKVYSAEGAYLGLELRSKVHDKQLFHVEVAVWIINSNKELLLEKRSVAKKLNPGRYSLCAGHVVGDDSVEETLIREAHEEIGLDLQGYDYQYVTVVTRREPKNYCFSHHYILFADINLANLTIQTEELSEVIFMNYKEFKRRVQNNDNTVALRWNEAYQEVFKQIDEKMKQHFGS